MKCLFEAVTVGFEPTGHVLHDTSDSSLRRYNQISVRHQKRKTEQSKSIPLRTFPLAAEAYTS